MMRDGVLFYNVTFRDCEFMCGGARGLFESHSSLVVVDPLTSGRKEPSSDVFFSIPLPPTHPYRLQPSPIAALATDKKDVLVGYYIICICTRTTRRRVPVIHYNTYYIGTYNTHCSVSI